MIRLHALFVSRRMNSSRTCVMVGYTEREREREGRRDSLDEYTFVGFVHGRVLGAYISVDTHGSLAIVLTARWCARYPLRISWARDRSLFTSYGLPERVCFQRYPRFFVPLCNVISVHVDAKGSERALFRIVAALSLVFGGWNWELLENTVKNNFSREQMHFIKFTF